MYPNKKSIQTLRNICNAKYKKYNVILKVYVRDNMIILYHFHNLGNAGNGKIALLELIKYADENQFKGIELEVIHVSCCNGLTVINQELVNYYKSLSFEILKIKGNNVTMVRCFN